MAAGSGILGGIILKATSKAKLGYHKNRLTLTSKNAKRLKASARFKVLPRKKKKRR